MSAQYPHASIRTQVFDSSDREMTDADSHFPFASSVLCDASECVECRWHAGRVHNVGSSETQQSPTFNYTDLPLRASTKGGSHLNGILCALVVPYNSAMRAAKRECRLLNEY